ncbi:MAG: hypothetical protein K8U57_24055 [Planctomycetes bacterium]|nr:hypothetical protein [Planctomycetota bacterium]
MSGRHGLIAGVVGILLAGSGCMSCGGTGYGLARQVGPECEALSCQRNQVYVFAISGVNPVEMAAVDTFRDQLNRKGFAKIGTGQALHATWMANEIKCIRANEPHAVFVFVGVEGGALTAQRLAEKVSADGVPVAAMVMFEHRCPARDPVNGCRMLTVAEKSISADESVAMVAELLNEIAAKVSPPIIVETTSWDYKHAPEPRPHVAPGHDPEWAFLFDEGVPTRAGTSPVPALATKPSSQPNATTARK